jgi:predicted lipoprotein with Yx(FWY)xxD motif
VSVVLSVVPSFSKTFSTVLYNWKNDKKPGDITGDGFLNGAWHIAQP